MKALMLGLLLIAMPVNSAVFMQKTAPAGGGTPVIESWAFSATIANKTLITVTKPTGVVSGDLLVIFVANRRFSGVGYTTPTGWTLAAESDAVGTGDNMGAGVYWRVSDGTEAATIDFTMTANVAMQVAYYLRISGANATPIDGTIAFPVTSYGYAVTTTAPTGTTASSPLAIVFAAVGNGSDATVTLNASGSYTEIDNDNTGASVGQVTGVFGTITGHGSDQVVDTTLPSDLVGVQIEIANQ